MPLQPEIIEFLAAALASGGPEVWEAPIAKIRELRMNRVALAGIPEPIYEIEHRYIAGPSSDLPIRIYRPQWHAPLPAMVYFHGGGWVLNTLDMFDQCLRSMANKGQFIIVAVNYQKAPEHPFPIPFDDCYATTKWVFENAQSLGIDPTQIGVGGDSAGGNLAAAVALKARDTKDFSLAFQLLLYPCNDYEMKYPSAIQNAQGFGLSTRAMKWFWDEYLQHPVDKQNPYAVPAVAGNFSNLPPAIIATAEYDPLLDDGDQYADLMREAGVPVIYREYSGMIHGFVNLGSITAEAEIAQQNFADEINGILQRSN
jgi:acetyl esterase